VAVANEIFSPAPAEVDWARGLLAAMEEGIAAGRGAVQLQGEMVDLANIKLAENIIAKADAIAAQAAG
nr:CoA ester lyase [Gammaproteobacteria bacterium]